VATLRPVVVVVPAAAVAAPAKATTRRLTRRVPCRLLSPLLAVLRLYWWLLLVSRGQERWQERQIIALRFSSVDVKRLLSLVCCLLLQQLAKQGLRVRVYEEGLDVMPAALETGAAVGAVCDGWTFSRAWSLASRPLVCFWNTSLT
jgi:hypothetical protein